jgi:hypothetical protein
MDKERPINGLSPKSLKTTFSANSWAAGCSWRARSGEDDAAACQDGRSPKPVFVANHRKIYPNTGRYDFNSVDAPADDDNPLLRI